MSAASIGRSLISGTLGSTLASRIGVNSVTGAISSQFSSASTEAKVAGLAVGIGVALGVGTLAAPALAAIGITSALAVGLTGFVISTTASYTATLQKRQWIPYSDKAIPTSTTIIGIPPVT